MNAEFNWWLLIVGLVLGASLTWLVMSESVRRDADVTESEERGEARWIAAVLSGAGKAIPAERVEEILRLHRDYLAAPPPDEPIAPLGGPPPDPVAAESAPAGTSAHAAVQDLGVSDAADRGDAADRRDAADPQPGGRLGQNG